MWWPFAHNKKNVVNTVKVPILFVPGVMGTKLTLPMNWDPDAKGGLYFLYHWGNASQSDKLASCQARQGDPDVVMNAKEDNGFGSVAAGFYKSFLKSLKKQEFSPALTPVYALGYDWRLSVAQSASYLRSRVLEILLNENAKRAIIISHSMGGLVTRTMLKQFTDTQSLISGVIHVVQPAVGAVVLYRRFFTGMQNSLDGSDTASKVLNSALGRKPADFAGLLSVLPGPVQLCPSGGYKRGAGWLNIDQFGFPPVLPQDQTIFDAYANVYSPPGMFNDILHHSPATRAGLADMIEQAQKFYDWMQVWKFEGKTKAIYSTGLATDVSITFQKPPQPPRKTPWPYMVDNLETVPNQAPEGDGTVPENSANALFPGEAYELSDANINDPAKHQFKVDNVAHADAFKSDAVKNGVFKLAQLAINQAIADMPK